MPKIGLVNLTGNMKRLMQISARRARSASGQRAYYVPVARWISS